MEKQTQQFSSCLFECVKVRALPSTLSASRTERPISNFSFPKNMKTRRDSRASSGLSERGARFVGSLSLSLDRTYVCTQQQQQQQMDEASQTRLTVKKKEKKKKKGMTNHANPQGNKKPRSLLFLLLLLLPPF